VNTTEAVEGARGWASGRFRRGSPPFGQKPVSTEWIARGVGVLVLLGFTLHGLGVISAPVPSTFALIFTSIVVEALPFILLGALVSAAIAVWVPMRTIEWIGRLPLALQVPGAAVAGFAFPVCECGSVPVARRLILRGVHPAAALAFMLAAPVVNPIVLASTWVAYSGRANGLAMVAGRCLLGLTVAVIAGLVIGGRTSGSELLRPRSDGLGPDHAEGTEHGKLGRLGEHVTADFLFMGKFIVIGGAVAALMQTAIPQGALTSLGGTPVLSALALMAVAFALSLCSEADAFVAVSLTAFPLGAQLAFLAFGPIADSKLAVLYGATFRRWFVLRLVLLTAPVIVAGSLLFEAVIR
jgi:uncharacterized membrane protein YraQ (UPF0718 family)